MTKFTGNCMCGQLSFVAEGEPAMQANCHCEDCRKTSGAAYSTFVFMMTDNVDISGTANTFNHTADSGAVLTKHFCGECGSPFASTHEARHGMIGIRAGIINEHDIVKPQANVFASGKLDCTILDPDIPAFDKMPG